MNITLHLAWRNLWRHAHRTWLTIGAMVFSNTILVFMLSLQFAMYGMMIDKFSQPGNVVFYLIFMVAVALHLSHALQSAVQTYGIYVPRKGSRIKLVSTLVATAMAATFAIMPVVAYLRTM